MTKRARNQTRLVTAALAGLLSSGCASELASVDVSETQCVALRDHILELRLKSAGLAPELLEQHRSNLRLASDLTSLEWCLQSLERGQVDCALGADSAAALETCLPPATTSTEDK